VKLQSFDTALWNGLRVVVSFHNEAILEILLPVVELTHLRVSLGVHIRPSTGYTRRSAQAPTNDLRR
jgi:hypothetical protein